MQHKVQRTIKTCPVSRHSSWRSAPAPHSRKAAREAASAMTRSRCRARVNRRARWNRHGAANPSRKQTSPAALRGKVVAEVVAAAEISTARGSSIRSGAAAAPPRAFVVTSGRIIGEGLSGTISPSGAAPPSAITTASPSSVPGTFRPQRLRNVPPIGRLRRNLDVVETVDPRLFPTPTDGAGEPQLCPIRSGIAAQYDPSL